MKKITFLTALVVLFGGAGCSFFGGLPTTSTLPSTTPNPTPAAHSDPKNTTYTIDGSWVTLTNGTTEITITTTTATKMKIATFGEPVYGDISGDGVPDAAMLLTINSGGSGTFYYVVAAIKNSDGYSGTNAVLLGDRIAPQTIEIKKDLIFANYAVRRANEAMTVRPSVGVTKYIKYENNALMVANAKDDVITLDMPSPSSLISSPLLIRGQARGNWFFEGSFPVVLVDWDGKIIARGIATAKGDWMTQSYVTFESKLTFTAPTSSANNRGALILKKDNPSGEPKNDDALEVTIYFAGGK